MKVPERWSSAKNWWKRRWASPPVLISPFMWHMPVRRDCVGACHRYCVAGLLMRCCRGCVFTMTRWPTASSAPSLRWPLSADWRRSLLPENSPSPGPPEPWRSLQSWDWLPTRRNMIRLSGATFRPISRSHRRYLPPLMCLRMQWLLRAAVVLNGKTDSAKSRGWIPWVWMNW